MPLSRRHYKQRNSGSALYIFLIRTYIYCVLIALVHRIYYFVHHACECVRTVRLIKKYNSGSYRSSAITIAGSGQGAIEISEDNE